MRNLIVDYRIDDKEINSLKKLKYNVLLCPPSSMLQSAICGHPDMLLNVIDKRSILVHKDMDLNFINILSKLGYKVNLSKNSLSYSYPQDIILNAVNLENVFVHKLKYTDPELENAVSKKQLINVKQGYTKCSTAVISKNAIITSDRTIEKSLREANFDVLWVPAGDILLPGFDYGFIGGCCGVLEEGLLGFYGNLKYYAYGDKIMEFLKKHHVEAVFLRDGKLIDRGTLISI